MSQKTININGFTLIEMLIVLMIMSLLLTVIPPLFSNALPSVTLKAAANDILHDFKYIRNAAILKSKKTEVIINTALGSYSSNDKNGGSVEELPAGVSMETSQITLSEADNDNAIIAFFSDGSSSGGIVKLISNNISYSILVDWLTGEISLHEGHVDE